MRKIIPFLALLLFAIIACENDTDAPSPNPINPATLDQIAEANQALGWRLFEQEQLAKPGENVLISPFSIQTALNMATTGAQGNTLTEMLDVLEWDNLPVGELNRLHRDLSTLLSEQSGHPELTLANRFFFDGGRLSVKAPFQDSLAVHYEAGHQDVDFNDEQAALDLINAWVKTNTNNKIDQILKQITALDVAFLINALHFKADWATGFDEDQTYPAPFTHPDGDTAHVNFVNADRNFTFAVTPDFHLVDIPFRDSTFSFSLIQPSPTNTDADWNLRITPAIWRGLYEQSQYDRAMVFFPKLKLAYENDLVNSLQNLGLQTAFSEYLADFTKMGTAANNVFIKQIAHKAVLEVDEKGAEGAAVTSIGFAINSAPPTFRFNRPFVLVLRHVPTNAILFIGYVADPK